MLPEALFYSTQKHSQSVIPPESYAEEEILLGSTQGDSGLL